MAKKICTGCKAKKNLEEFTKTKQNNSGRTAKCKGCNAVTMKEYADKNRQSIRDTNLKSYYKHHEKRKEEEKQCYLSNIEERLKSRKQYYVKNNKKVKKQVMEYYNSFKDGKYHVYTLPEEHYCGQTVTPVVRERQHRQHGRVTYGMEIVSSFKTKKEALQLEKAFHKLGWYGENELHSGNFKYE